jgi:hypothetical protein
MILGFIHPLTEMNTRNFPWQGKELPARNADDLTATGDPIV